MNIILQQLDITLNQCHNPHYELRNISVEDKKRYEEDIEKRIKRRIDQIDNLRKINNNLLNDEEYCKLINKVYFVSYENKYILRLNYISDYNLMLFISVSSKNKIDGNRFFSLNEILDLITNNEVIIHDVHFCEYDYKYYKMVYGEEIKKFKNVSDKELSEIYSLLNNKKLLNKKVIKDIRQTLDKSRINSDLKNIIDFTNFELNYIRNLDEDINVKSLTY